MDAILAVTVPFFALVLCGYLAADRRVLPENAIPGLNTFVLFFALPCMLFRFGASMPLRQLIDPVLIGLYSAAAVLLVFFTVALTWQRADELAKASAVQADHAKHLGVAFHSPRALARRFDPARLPPIRPDRTNPLPWAIALGALFQATGIGLPGPIAQIVRMLGDAATPVALFTIGAVLWRARQHVHTRTPVRAYLPVALVKLLVHPLLVASLGVLAHRAGMPVSPAGLTVRSGSRSRLESAV